MCHDGSVIDRLDNLERLLGQHLTNIERRLRRMEHRQMTEADQIDQVATAFDAFAAEALADLEAIAAERDQLGPDGQAALDRLTQKIKDATTAVEAVVPPATAEAAPADGSVEPAPQDGTAGDTQPNA
jgi:uncharacterized coiled-coil protein SlyX